MPPCSIREPAIINRGTASSVKLLTPESICWNTTTGDRWAMNSRYIRDDPPRARAMGAPINSSVKNIRNKRIAFMRRDSFLLVVIPCRYWRFSSMIRATRRMSLCICSSVIRSPNIYSRIRSASGEYWAIAATISSIFSGDR